MQSPPALYQNMRGEGEEEGSKKLQSYFCKVCIIVIARMPVKEHGCIILVLHNKNQKTGPSQSSLP